MQRTAFSLVELSIVLVIVGLLVGGIMAGQSLVRSAEMRAVTTELNRFATSYTNFQTKYNALPGDMLDATSYWGTAAACPGAVATGSTTAATCDGDGNTQISGTSTSREWARAWQHLANAGMIEGYYSGVSGVDSYSWNSTYGNSPESKARNGLWTVYYIDNTASTFTSGMFNLFYGNALLIGSPTAASWLNSPVMNPQEAWAIDSKIDDGKPAQGKVVGSYMNSCTTAGANTIHTGDYVRTSTTNACFLMFRNYF